MLSRGLFQPLRFCDCVNVILKPRVSAHLIRDLRQYVLALLAALQEIRQHQLSFPSFLNIRRQLLKKNAFLHDRSVIFSWMPRVSVLWGIILMHFDSMLRSDVLFASLEAYCCQWGCLNSLVPTHCDHVVLSAALVFVSESVNSDVKATCYLLSWK